MADTKVSALTALAASAIATDDEMLIVDTSATASKKIDVADLVTYLQANGMPRVKRLGTTHTTTVVAPTKVTDLDMTLEAGTFTFDYRLIVRSATTTVAPQFNFNFTGTGVPTWWYQYADLSGTLLAAIGQLANAVTTPTLGFQMATAVNVEATTGAAKMGPVNGVQATGQDIMVKIVGIVVVTVSGNLELWHGSETATSTSVEVGSSLVVVRTA